jgi:hypothetical protein
MNKIHTILFLSCLLVIAGCTSGDSTSSGRFIGGDRGLEISFVPNEPPAEVLDANNENFDISVLLRNVGESNVDKGEAIVTIHGLDQSSFSLNSLSERSDSDIERRQRIGGQITEPDEVDVRFRGANYKEDLDAAFDNEIRADVCYPYTTLSVADLCLKRNPTERRTRDQCDVSNNQINIDNSGAPVHVANVLQRSSGTDIIKFTFDVVRVGSGDVFDPGAFSNECISNDGTRDDEDKVLVTVSSRGDLPISCSRLNDGVKGTIELINGRRSVRCDIDTSSLQEIAFERRVNIKLDYYYKDSTTTFLRVADTDQLN